MYGSGMSLAQEEFLGEPHDGDFNQGSGTSTSQLANPNVSLAATKGGTMTTGPVFSWGVAIVVILLLVAVKFMAEKAGKDSEFSTVRIGFENLFVVTGLAAVGFYILKMIAYVLVKTGPFVQFVGAI